MIKSCCIAALALIPLCAKADPSTCLSASVTANEVALALGAEPLGQTITVEAVIANELTVPVAGLMVEYQLWSSDRPVTLARGTVAALVDIPGGLLPGEELTFEHPIWLDERAQSLAQDASALMVRFVVLNALSSENIRHTQGPFMSGWSGSGVTLLCGES